MERSIDIFFYKSSNQKIENDLVAKVAFIEDHKGTVALMEATDTIGATLMDDLKKIDITIPKIALSGFGYTFTITAAHSMAGQFLGGYYHSSDINSTAINVMIMSLISNLQNIMLIFTYSYTYVKLNLEQLEAFDRAYEQCVAHNNLYNKVTKILKGNEVDKFSILNLTVYKPELEEGELSLTKLFDQLTLELSTNKIYKLNASSGSGKTTFLKSITGNWQYTEGTVIFPISCQEDIYFIPQHSFLYSGTLIEILTYPLTPKKFLSSNAMLRIIHRNTLQTLSDEQKNFIVINKLDDSDLEVPLLSGCMKDSVQTTDDQTLYKVLAEEVKNLLMQMKVHTIKESELELPNIDWNERLSGGEKQKIGIIRGILNNPSFLIMDEATSALDSNSRELVYSVIKEYIKSIENYIIIYTDHVFGKDFADANLVINGQNIEVENI